MSKNPSISAETRKIQGRKVKQLRRKNIIPANIFGSGISSQSIQVDLQDFHKLYQQAGETSVIDLNLDEAKKTLPVMIHQLQQDPVSGDILHVDFLQVDLTKKVTTQVPIEITGESPAVKDKAGVLVQSLNELEIEALPADIPDQIELDISSLIEFGDSISASDLKLGSKVTLITDKDTSIATVQEPKEEEEPETEVSQEESDQEESAEKDESSEGSSEDSSESKAETADSDKSE